MYQADFVYLPQEGDKPAKWINLGQILEVEDVPNNGLFLWHIASVFSGDSHEEFPTPFEIITGEQAAVLRRHLSGRHLSHRSAFENLESRLEARGSIA